MNWLDECLTSTRIITQAINFIDSTCKCGYFRTYSATSHKQFRRQQAWWRHLQQKHDNYAVFQLALNYNYWAHSTLQVECVWRKWTDSILSVTFDKFRQLFIIFDMNYPDNPWDWKIVKYPINTCTKLRNDDIIVTSLKNAIFGKRETPEFILPLLWPPNLPDLNLVD